MHYKFVPSNDPIKLDKKGRMTNYSSSGSSVMVPCPCELNIKIQELTEEYYGAA